jgi:hypothetical protein
MYVCTALAYEHVQLLVAAVGAVAVGAVAVGAVVVVADSAAEGRSLWAMCDQ